MSSLTIPSSVDAHAVTAAQNVMQAAPEKPATLALVSGGHDSLTAMHLAYQSPDVDLTGIVHINTGIGVPETNEFVRAYARQLGLDYYEVGAWDDALGARCYRYQNEEYAEQIIRYGFPGPPLHKVMYRNLKEKPLQRFLNDHFPDREVTLVSGVRRHESTNRMENVDSEGMQEYLGAPTISPLVEFTALDVRRYRSGLKLAMNPVVDALEMSGECLCGAHASRGELRMIRLFYPDVYRYLLCLEAKVAAASFTEDGPGRDYIRWGHGRLKTSERKALDDPDQMLLCATCEFQASCDGDEC